MDLGTLDLNLLTAFEALYLDRSVTRAAARLGIRQPAMSETLARLRTALGDPLFERAAGHMQPSPLARKIAPGVMKALEELRATLGEAVPFTPEREARRFTIASTDYTSAVIVPALVSAAAASAPGVDLQVIGYDKDDVGSLLDRGEADLALGVFPAPPLGAVKKPLFTERFLGVARPGHPAIVAGQVDLDRFCAYPHALVSLRRDRRGALDEALAEVGQRRRIALVTPHMASLPETLLRSDLLAAMPARMIVALAGGLEVFELPVETAPWPVEMLWSPLARRDQASEWLRLLVRRCCEEL